MFSVHPAHIRARCTSGRKRATGFSQGNSKEVSARNSKVVSARNSKDVSARNSKDVSARNSKAVTALLEGTQDSCKAEFLGFFLKESQEAFRREL
ncbi:hypothetical protein BaRGS_00029809 [Batillaria attramentaria]|uniref:Uncharacterized protein n=1 Tax=Batillaria attramentaria TaxID=370345 RepID=A0ABD0JV47_9CAEN